MKVDDIRPDALMDGQRAAMVEDIAFLRDRSDRFVEVGCPACGGGEKEPLYEKYGMAHQRCRACSTQFISPRPTPELLGEFYAGSVNYAYWAKYIFPASAESRRVGIFEPRARMVADACRERGLGGGAIVEIGAGYGQFCDEIRKLDVFERVIGVEPTPDLAQVCRDKGVEVIESPYEQARLDSGASMIVAFEVLEHLFDPFAFARWSFDALVPGGALLVTCPNIRGLDTILLGREATAVDHEHLNYFHPTSLGNMLDRAGFESVETSTPGKLDVDLLRRGRAEGQVSDAVLGPILAAILDAEDPVTAEEMQSVVRRAKLSSHLMAIAIKPKQ